MQLEGALRAVQMLGSDVGNLTANLALTRGQMDAVLEIAREINPPMWGRTHPEEGGEETFIRLPIGQYQAIIRLLDALS